MTTNYQALGEHTAYTAQAKDAALRRMALLNNLSVLLHRLSERPGEPLSLQTISEQLDQAAAAEREMNAALDRANQAAALFGQPDLRPERLLR